MPAAHDATTTQAGSGADFDHTPSGTPTLARVSVHMRPGDTDTLITGVTYGGEAMTRKLHIDTTGDTTPGGNLQDFVEIWTLENPPSGQQTVSITRTGTVPNRQVYICSTYTGTGAAGTPVATSDNSNSYSTVELTGISSETDGIVLDALTTQEQEDHTPDEDNTGRERADLSDDGTFRGCASDAAGAASVNMGWSWSTNTRYAYIAIPVAPAGAPTNLALDNTDPSITDPGHQLHGTFTDQTGGSLPHTVAWRVSGSGDDFTYVGLPAGTSEFLLTFPTPALYQVCVFSVDGEDESAWVCATAATQNLAIDTDEMADGWVPLFWTAFGTQALIHRVLGTSPYTPDEDSAIAALGGSDEEYVDNEANSESPPLHDVYYTYVITDGAYNVLSDFVTQKMPPPRPTGLIVDDVQNDEVTITVVPIASSTRNRLIWQWRTAGSGPYSTLGTFGSVEDQKTYVGLSVGTSYDFRVASYSTTTGLQSGWTEITQATTGALPDGVPGDLSVDAYDEDSADVSWTDNASNETGYYLHLSQSPGFTMNPATRDGSDLGANAESGGFTGLAPETTYYWGVEVYNASGSVYSDVSSFTTLAAPETEAIAAGIFAYGDFRYGMDPIAGRATPLYTVRGVAPLTGRDGRLVDVPGVSPPMAWLRSEQPTTAATKRQIWPGDSLQVLRLFPAATNVELLANDLSGWTLSNLTRTPNYGEGPYGTAVATLLSDADGSNIGYVLKDLTVDDDSTCWVGALYVEKFQEAATAVCRFRFELVGGSSEVYAGIELWPDTGQFAVFGASLFGFVRDEGDRWLVVVAAKNNGSGNTILRRLIYPAYDDELAGVGDASLQQAVVVSGLDVKNEFQWTPHVVTTGDEASHVARDARFKWLLGPQPEAGYIVLIPWFVPGHGQGFYRLYSRGGHVDIAGDSGLAIWVSPTGTDRIGFKLANGFTTVVQELNVTWVPGQVLEVAWRIVPTTLPAVQLYLSAATDWGAWSDAGPSTAIDLPSSWDLQEEALGEVVDGELGRISADFMLRKVHGDYTLEAEDMRQLYKDVIQGLTAA